MPLIATDTATNTGGGVYQGSSDPAAPIFNGGRCIKVGEGTTCPGAAGAGPGGYGNHPVDGEGNRLPFQSTITTGSEILKVNGVSVAIVGSKTSCGHDISTAGINSKDSVNS